MPALRWAAMRAILMFRWLWQAKTQGSTNHNFWRERKPKCGNNPTSFASLPKSFTARPHGFPTTPSLSPTWEIRFERMRGFTVVEKIQRGWEDSMWLRGFSVRIQRGWEDSTWLRELMVNMIERLQRGWEDSTWLRGFNVAERIQRGWYDSTWLRELNVGERLQRPRKAALRGVKICSFSDNSLWWATQRHTFKLFHFLSSFYLYFLFSFFSS